MLHGIACILTYRVSSFVLQPFLTLFMTSLLLPPTSATLGLAAHPSRHTPSHHHHRWYHQLVQAFDNASAFVAELPEQLNLGWLHTLAGQVPGPAFIPPTCDFEVLEGPHSEAVMKVTTQLCNALELASSRLVACGIHTVALDLATQVSLDC